MEKRLKTENGMDIFWYPNRHTHSFCLSLYIRAGCIYESDEDNGITHFMEHLIFRSINRHMGGAMYQTLDQKGLYFNGATYKEFIQLYIIGAPQHFSEAADILLKVFEPFALPAEEVRTEQQRVKAEIREAGELKTLDWFAGTFAWNGTGARNTILGTKGRVSRFTGKKMEQYRQQVLQGGNAFFYVTGCVSDSQIETLGRKTEKCSLQICSNPRDNRTAVPADFGRRKPVVHLKNSEYFMVQFSFDLVTERYTAAELSLLYDILFSGENSLIHQELSEKRGWIYSYSSTLEKYSNIGRIYFTYEIGRKEMADSIELVLKSLTDLADLETLEKRLSFVLPEYVDNAYMIYDDNEGFNWQRAYECHIMGNAAATIEESRASFASVTAPRLLEMIGEIFRSENLVLSLKGRKKQMDLKRIERIAESFADSGRKGRNL